MNINHFKNSHKKFVTDPVTENSCTQDEFYRIVQTKIKNIIPKKNTIYHLPISNTINSMTDIVAHAIKGSCIQLKTINEDNRYETINETKFDLVIGSSGSTGAGRRIKLNWTDALKNSKHMTEHMSLNSENIHMLLMPLHHVNSLFYSFFSSVIIGQHIIMPSKINFLQFWKWVKKYNINSVNVSPTIIKQLNRRPTPKNHQLKNVLSASSALSKKDFEIFKNKTGIEIIQGYGLSEATNFSTVMPIDPAERNAVNQFFKNESILSIGTALPEHNIKIKNEKKEGELLINSPSNFVGYLNENVDTGWVHTGDLGYYKIFKGKKYWFLKSRIKEIIKYRDQTLYPQDIEQWVQNQLNLPISFFCFGFKNNFDIESIGMLIDKNNWSTKINEKIIEFTKQTYSYYPRLIIIRSISNYLTTTNKPQRIKTATTVNSKYQEMYIGKKIMIDI